MPHTLTWSYRDDWPAEPRHIADARTFVESRLQEHDLDDAAMVLRLVVSELVTNAVLHAATPFSVSLSRDDGALRLVVTDGLQVPLPAPAPRLPTQPNGRGLCIVERLSTEWGVDPGTDGKAVWAVFELPVVAGAARAG